MHEPGSDGFARLGVVALDGSRSLTHQLRMTQVVALQLVEARVAGVLKRAGIVRRQAAFGAGEHQLVNEGSSRDEREFVSAQAALGRTDQLALAAPTEGLFEHASSILLVGPRVLWHRIPRGGEFDPGRVGDRSQSDLALVRLAQLAQLPPQLALVQRLAKRVGRNRSGLNGIE